MQRANSIQSVFRVYRLALSGLFAATALLASDGQVFAESDAAIFFGCSLIWFLLTLVSGILSQKHPETAITNTINLVVDMIALAILGWLSGGLSSGIHYLMLPSAAIAGLMLGAQLALFVAAIASLSILSGQAALYLSSDASISSLLPAGLLGAMLFACTAAFKMLEMRLTASEQRAEISDAKATEYQQLSDAVITQMLTGVIVVNEHEIITLSNPSAERMLSATNSLTTDTLGLHLERFKSLYQCYRRWKENPSTRIESFTHDYSGLEIQPAFRALSRKKPLRTLITLEDTQQLRQQAQQAKVFALGKLSTSLAHEVRNPLSAINQANDLLQASSNLDKEEQDLVGIIARHCERMDKTISVTNQLARQLHPEITSIELEAWLESFVIEYKESQPTPCEIHLKLAPNPSLSFDPQHLTQILRNLIDNGLRYSEEACGKRDVAILSSFDRAKRLVFIDVHDRGLGIPQQEVENVFAPFHSKSGGAGIGLYICRELCDANFASINYLYKSEAQESGFFRLTAWIEPPNQ